MTVKSSCFSQATEDFFQALDGGVEMWGHGCHDGWKEVRRWNPLEVEFLLILLILLGDLTPARSHWGSTFKLFLKILWQPQECCGFETHRLPVPKSASNGPLTERWDGGEIPGFMDNLDVNCFITNWWFQSFFIFHFIYGMSSFPWTNLIFFKMVKTC